MTAILLALLAGLAAQVAPAAPGPKPAPLPRVLVYTTSAGFEHEVVKRPAPDAHSLVEATLVEMARTSRAFEAVVSRDTAQFDPASIARYDAVLFYTTGELPLSPVQRRALLDFV